MKRKQLFPGPVGKPTWEGLRARALDASGIEVRRSMSLSTPIVSVQDGPRMTGISNFGGKKAAPFRKGGKRRAKVQLAKRALAKKALKKGADLSVLSASDRKALPSSSFVFPGAKRYPIPDLAHARNALARSAGKPEAAVVRAAVYRKFPQLKGK